jgi:DNA-binding transcriptional MocR family regulator
MLPLALIREAAAAKFAEQDPLYLQYGHIYGFPKFRGESRRPQRLAAPCSASQLTLLLLVLLMLAVLCCWSRSESLSKFLAHRYGHPVDPEKLMATNGNTGAIALICSLFTKSGDIVYAEEPTYFLAKSIFADFKLDCRK